MTSTKRETSRKWVPTERMDNAHSTTFGKRLRFNSRELGYVGTRGRIHSAIMSGEEFHAGHMGGVRYPGTHNPYPMTGALADKYLDSVMSADYVVYSYTTPIAWHINGGSESGDWWVVPDVKYSTTTTKHQGIVNVALSLARILPYDEDGSEAKGEE